jgi:hypothetical protein
VTHVLHSSYSRIKTNSISRSENDFYPTPPVATYALVRKYPGLKTMAIDEPAAGRGWMARELDRCGAMVNATDLFCYDDPLFPVDFGSDFLERTESGKDRAMITNPPFKNDGAEKFVRHAFELNYSFIAIFARITFLESMKRYRLFTEKKLHGVYIFSGRVNCDETLFEQDKQMGGLIAYGWFVWIPGSMKMWPTISWIDTKTMLEDWKAETSAS